MDSADENIIISTGKEPVRERSLWKQHFIDNCDHLHVEVSKNKIHESRGLFSMALVNLNSYDIELTANNVEIGGILDSISKSEPLVLELRPRGP